MWRIFLVIGMMSLIGSSIALATPLEIAYDDGNRVFSTNMQPQQRGGVLFQPSTTMYPFRVLLVRVWFSTPGSFTVHLLTGTELGQHNGVDEITPFTLNANQTAHWDTIDFRSYNVVLSEDFMFAGQWISTVPQIWGDGSGSGHFWRDNGVGWFEYTAMDPLIRATIETNAGVQIELSPVPTANDFRLINVYPNPWNSEAKASIQINIPQHIRFDLWNVCGQQVTTLWQGTMSPGIHSVFIDGSNLTSGTYFITAFGEGNRISTIPCILIK
jgi:hypothetical protein